MIRSGDEWLVNQNEDVALKASIGTGDPILPPTTGWFFENWHTNKE